MSELALKLIRENKRTKDTFLDLGNCGLKELPDELMELTHLTSLNLGSYYFDSKKNIPVSSNQGSPNSLSNIDKLISLINIKSLSLSVLPIRDITPLKNLINIQNLFLSHTPIQNIWPLGYLTNIQNLFLSHTPVQDIWSLQDLINIQTLSLSHTRIQSTLPLKNLIHIQNLFINSTQVQDIWPLKNLINIQALDLSHTKIQDINSLQNLTNIQALHLSNTQIQDLNPIQNLTNIQALHLSNTKIQDINPLQYLTKIQTLRLGHTLIQDINSLQNLIRIQSLYLNNTKIQDINPLQYLTNIEYLDLNNTSIHNLNPLQYLTNIQSLYLNNTKTQDINPLQNLTNIQSLYLNNTKIQDLTPLKNLINIQIADLSNVKIQDLTPLKNLINTQALYLSNTKIQDISPLQYLTNIQDLHLSGTKIQDINPLQYLTNIQSLYLSGTKIQDLTPIQNLTTIQAIDLSYTSIQDLTPIRNLTNIQSLYLSGIKAQDLSPIQNLTNIQSLYLSHTLIQDLTPLQNLINIRYLDLRNTKVNSLEKVLNHIKEGLKVYLHNNVNSGISVANTPLKYPPLEIVEEGNLAIINYFEELENQGEDYIYEAKLLIVGKGGAGKTSLAIKLNDDKADLPQEEATTRGIEIKQITFPCESSKTFTINIWDFGGQEIYHSTHQFFLTKKSLYVLLDDTRESDKTVNDDAFKYWLEVVRLFGGGSPLLIVQNEKGNRSKDIDLKGMQAQFGFIKEKLTTNLANNRGLEEVKAAIQYHIQKLPHIGDALPKNWSAIRTRLLTIQQEKPHITLQEYLDLCTQEGIPDKTKALYVSDYLHNLGNLLHFQDNSILKRLVILQNKWATDAVYRVLDNEPIKINKGYFSFNQLSTIWSEDIYESYLPELLELMLNFELCYELETKHNYLIPGLLPESRPDNFTWSYENNLQLRYRYKFMPKGILSRFIVRMNTYIKDRSRIWKNGVVLTRNNTYAFINEVYGENELKVHVYGEEPRDFVILIAEKIEQLNNEFEGIILTKEVPCICDECKNSKTPAFYDFNDVSKARRAKNGEIQCRHSFEMVNAMRLLDNISNVYDKRTEGISGDNNHFISGHNSIHIHNHLPPSNNIVAQETIAPISSEVQQPVSPPKKFYQEWWAKNIIAGILSGLFISIGSYWFELAHPFTGFYIGAAVVTFVLFLRGNPERRFYRAASFSLVAAVSIFSLQLSFSFRQNTTTPEGGTQIIIEWLSEYEWLIALALILLSTCLFYMDYQRAKK